MTRVCFNYVSSGICDLAKLVFPNSSNVFIREVFHVLSNLRETIDLFAILKKDQNRTIYRNIL